MTLNLKDINSNCSNTDERSGAEAEEVDRCVYNTWMLQPTDSGFNGTEAGVVHDRDVAEVVLIIPNKSQSF